MKNKKWLLAILLLVLIVNTAFFVLVRLAGIDRLIQEKFAAYLAAVLQAEVEIGNFTFNDKQLKISGLKLESPDVFSLQINQIYIRYKLLPLLFSNFKDLHSIKQIDIYEPVLNVIIKPAGKKKTGGRFEIPDIAEYFRQLKIHNAKITITFSKDDIFIQESWQNLNLSVSNTDRSVISLTAGSAAQDSILADARLNKGKIEAAQITIRNLNFDDLQLPGGISPQFFCSINAAYKDDELSYNAAIEDISLTVSEIAVSAAEVLLNGNDEQVSAEFQELVVDGNDLSAAIMISELMTSNRTISAELAADDLLLENYLDNLYGRVKAGVNVSGLLSAPRADILLQADSLSVFGKSILNARIETRYQDQRADIELIDAYWQNNLITGFGRYQTTDGLAVTLQSADLAWEMNDLLLSADLECSIHYDSSLLLALDLNELAVKRDNFLLSGLTLNAELADQLFSASLNSNAKSLQINLQGSLDPPRAEGKIELRRFDLGTVFAKTSLPLISGNFDLSADQMNLMLDSSLRIYDKEFGKLNGRLISNLKLDLAEKRSQFNLRTINANYNYEQFEIDLQAEGTLDSIRTTHLKINNEFRIDGWIKLKPKLDYGIKLTGEGIRIRDFARYFMSYYTYSELFGSTSFDLEYDSRQEGRASGRIVLDKITFGDLKRFDGEINLQGNNQKLFLEKTYLSSGSTKLFDLNGEISLIPHFALNAAGAIDSLSLEDIFSNNEIEGSLDGSFRFQKNNLQSLLEADLQLNRFKYDQLKIDEIKLSFCQEDSLLTIYELMAKKSRQFDLQCSGAIGYNLLNSNSYPDTNRVRISFQGDLFAFLSRQWDVIRYGESETSLEVLAGIGDNGFKIDHGWFELQNGSLIIAGQPNKVDKCKINIRIENDKLAVNDFRFKMGEGFLYLENEIMQNDNDFLLGMLNLGKFKVRTSNAGLQIYLPQYTPDNTMINVDISGRNSRFLEILGPFDDLSIIGDLRVFNGDLIYPPNTENLMKLFNVVAVEKKPETDPLTLPLSFDLLLHLGENVRYVTYPVDLRLKPDGYLRLQYTAGDFLKPEAFFLSEEGSVDMFGTTLLLDYLQINLTRIGSGTRISGLFYKKTSDGSLITLEIFNDDAGDGSFGNLRFELKSDNPNDLITDILAKLRYNRSMDEISPAQKKTLLQDEVIQIAGLGLESAVLDPLISPVENFARKLFRLDYFHLQTDLVQNLFSSYTSDVSSDYSSSREEMRIDQLSSELFLNNLSISAGKYVSRKVFLDYKARFEKQGEYLDDTNLGIYQDFVVRYDLPWKLKLSYKYSILPFKEDNEHQIGIERSFKF